VSLFDQAATEAPIGSLKRKLGEFRGEFLVVQADSQNLKVIREIVGWIRSTFPRPPMLVAMGPYADALPEKLLDGGKAFDACIVGEPEDTVVELASAVAAGASLEEIAGLAFLDGATGKPVRTAARPPINDLDRLPFPLYSGFDLDQYVKQSSFVPILGPVRWGWIMSSRGCPFDCEFCSPTLRKSHGAAYRTHSAAYVGDQAAHLVDRFGCNAIAFEDDLFSFSKAHTLDICDEFIRRRLGCFWTVQTHLATLDGEVIGRMRDAGCRGVCAGIETGDDSLRFRLKGGSLPRELILRNVRLIKERGMALTLYFMIGCPGETIEQMRSTFELAMELKPDMIQVAFFTPYPGSPAYGKLDTGPLEEGMSHYDSYGMNMSDANREEVVGLYRRFYKGFYYHPETIARLVRGRLPYVITQHPLDELKLVWRAVSFMAGHVWR
jgi:radical SAM superfamily enzyme YgiQ (UPF0313 family)